MDATGGTQKICRLNVNGVTVSGAGNTEEEARDNVLKKVKEMVHHSPIIPAGEMLSATLNSAHFGAGRSTSANMVGRLQELCVAKHWPLPVYNLLDSQGPSHMPVFMMTCCVRDFVAVGNGKTKKEAKHHAAQRLLDMITGAGSQDQESVPVGRVRPLCAPPQVTREVDIVYVERRRFQSPNLQPTRSITDYRENSPLHNGTLLALKANERKSRSLSAERVAVSVSEVSECKREPIPLPSVEDYLCGRFQEQVEINEGM